MTVGKLKVDKQIAVDCHTLNETAQALQQITRQPSHYNITGSIILLGAGEWGGRRETSQTIQLRSSTVACRQLERFRPWRSPPHHSLALLEIAWLSISVHSVPVCWAFQFI